MSSEPFGGIFSSLGWRKKASKRIQDAVVQLFVNATVPPEQVAARVVEGWLEEALEDVPALPHFRDAAEWTDCLAFIVSNLFPAKSQEDELVSAFTRAQLFIESKTSPGLLRGRTSQTREEPRKNGSEEVLEAIRQLSVALSPSRNEAKETTQPKSEVKKSTRVKKCAVCKSSPCTCVIVTGVRSREPAVQTQPLERAVKAPTRNEEAKTSEDEDDPDEESESGTDEGNGDDQSDEEPDAEDELERNDLEDPGVFLEPKVWAETGRSHGPLELQRAVRNFYRQVAAKKPHEEVFLSDVLLATMRALSVGKKTESDKILQNLGVRILSRYEFFASQQKIGNFGASAVEAEMVERSLPKTIRAARRRGEKVVKDQSQHRRTTPSKKASPKGKGNKPKESE